MELKDQVCSFELAKKLKELGFEQESLFYWVEIEYKHFQLLFFEEGWQYKKEDWKDCEGGEPKHYPAYTVAELYSLLYSLLYSNGICDMVISEEPNNLANYLAERLCQLKK